MPSRPLSALGPFALLVVTACAASSLPPSAPTEGAALSPQGPPEPPSAPATSSASVQVANKAPAPPVEPTGVAECDVLVGMLEACMSKLGPTFGERAAHSSLAANVARVRQLTQGRTDADPGDALQSCQVGIRDLRAHPC